MFLIDEINSWNLSGKDKQNKKETKKNPQKVCNNLYILCLSVLTW